MNYYLLSFIISLVILFGVIIYLVILLRKKRKSEAQRKQEILNEIVKDFNQAEEMMKGGIYEDDEANSNASNPYSILWKIAKGKRIRGTDITTGTTEQRIDIGELHPESIRRQDIPSGTTTSNNEDISGIRQPKRRSSKNFFAKFARR